MSGRWLSIGPLAALGGGGAGRPTCGGPVTCLAVIGPRVYAGTRNGGVWRSDDGGQSWWSTMGAEGDAPGEGFDPNQPVPHGDGLAIGAIGVAPGDADRIYAGTGVGGADDDDLSAYAGVGVVVSFNGGITWTRETGTPDLLGARVRAIAVDKANPDIAVAATDRGVFRRDPATGTWQRSVLHLAPAPAGPGTDVSSADFTDLIRATDTVWYAARRGGPVFRSTDQGQHFDEFGAGLVAAAGERVRLAASAAQADLLYALTPGAVLQVLDNVATPAALRTAWMTVGNTVASADLLGPPALRRAETTFALVADPGTPSRVYLGGHQRTVAGEDGAFVARCDIAVAGAGRTSTTVRFGAQAHPGVSALAIDPERSNRLWLGTLGGVWLVAEATALAPVAEARNHGLACQLVTALAQHPLEPAYLLAGTLGNGLVRTQGEPVWSVVRRAEAAGRAAIIAPKADGTTHLRLVVPLGRDVQRSAGGDQGAWSTCFSVPPDEPLGLAINHAPQPVLANVPINAATPADSERLVLATDRLRFSDDAGATWSAATPVVTAAAPGSGDLFNRRAVRCALFLDAATLAVGLNNGEVYRFTRAGDGSWAKQRIDTAGGLPTGGARITAAVSAIALLPGGTDKLLVSFAGSGAHARVWRYDHAAAAPKWSERIGPAAPSDERLPALPVNALAAWQGAPADPVHWFAGTDDGLWRSIDEGAHWARHDEGLPDAAVIDLSVHAPSGLIRAATAGRGVYERQLAADEVAVQLVLRNHPLDLRRPDAQALPRLDPIHTANLASPGNSPDLRFDAPDGALAYQRPPGEPIDAIDFAALSDEGSTIPVAGGPLPAPIPVMVHVQVHNRGTAIANHVSVTLLVARHDGADLVPPLPSHLAAHVALGTTIDDEAWTVLDRISVHGVAAGRPAIASFVVEAAAFAQADGFKATVIALAHHADDPYTNTESVPTTLSAAERKSARRVVVGRNFALGAAPAPTLAEHGWTAIGPAGTRRGQTGNRDNPVSGRVTGIAVAPGGNRVYVATANGGVWRSDDRGRHWQAMDQLDGSPVDNPLPGTAGGVSVGIRATGLDSQSCGAIAIDDAHPDIVYLGTGEANNLGADSFHGIGPLFSNDGGRTWRVETTDPPDYLYGQSFFALVADPTDGRIVVGGTDVDVVARDTAGVWHRVRPTSPAASTPTNSLFSGIAVGFAGGTRRFFAANIVGEVYACAGRPWIAGDWVALPKVPNMVTVPNKRNSLRLAIAACRTNPDLLYAFDDEGHVYLSTATGGVFAPWARLAGEPARDALVREQGSYDLVIQVAPDNPHRIYLGACAKEVSLNWAGAVYRCEVEPGQRRLSATFIGNGVHSDCHALAMPADDPKQLWVGCDGGVYLAEDVQHGDEPFVPRNAGISSMTFVSFACHPSEPAVVFASAQDNGGQLGTGEETFQLGATGDGGYGWFHPTDPTRVFSTYLHAKVRRSTHGGIHDSFSDGPKVNGFDDDKTHPVNDLAMFYAPLVGMPPGTPAAQAGQLAFGHRRLFFSDDFGDRWRSLPGDDKTADRIGDQITAVEFIDADTIVAGSLGGRIERYTRAAGTWTRSTLVPGAPPPGVWTNGNPVSDIERDPRPGQAGSFFVTVGGASAGVAGPGRIWHFANATSTWTDLSGSGASAIINAQANTVVADLQGANLTLFVGMDIGVWACTAPFPATAGTQAWAPINRYLPDAAVVDLKLVPQSRLLRAALYGRGLYDLDLARGVPLPGAGVQAQAVELYLRAHQLDLARLDAGRAPRRYGGTNPLALDTVTAFGDVPDVRIDRPDGDGAYQLPLDHEPDFVTFVDRLTDRAAEVMTHARSLVNRVYVQVHNRGPRVADRVRVALWLAPRATGTQVPPDLPADYRMRLKLRSPVLDANWTVVGYAEVDGVRATTPRVVGFDLRSDLLPKPDALSGHEQWSLLVLLDHDDDPWRSDITHVRALTDNDAKAVCKAITVKAFDGRHPGTGRFIARPYLRHLAVALAMQERLATLDTAMAARVAGPRVSDLDRRLAFLAGKALAGARTGARVPQAVETPAVVHLTRFHLAGLRAWEWADDIDRLEASAGWIEDVLHRGSVDANLSLREVPAGRFLLRVAERAWTKAAGKPQVQQAIGGFVTGMAAALASEVVLRPVLSGQQARHGALPADHRHPTGAGLAVERWVSQALLNGSPEREGFAAWWPGAGELPQELIEGYAEALTEVYAPATRTGARFHDAPELPMAVPSAKDLREGHGVFLQTLDTGFGAGWWFLILLPLILAPSFGLILARQLRGPGDRPNALLNEVPTAGDNPDGAREFDTGSERDWSDLVGSLMLTNSLTPFVYAMILWGVLPRRGVTGGLALGSFLARALSAGFFLGTRNDANAAPRWGSVLPQLGLDIAWLVSAIRQSAKDHPGQARQHLLQGFPLIQLGTGTLFTLLLRLGAPVRFKSDLGFWLWLLGYTAINVLLIGLPTAFALDRAGGALRYFSDRVDPELGPAAVLAAREPRPALAYARVMPEGTGWDTGDAAEGHARYAADRRILLKLWYGGPAGSRVTLRQRRDRLVFQRDADAAVEVVLAAAVQSSGLVALIEGAIPELHAAVASAADPEYYLPWPATVDDPGDTATTLAEHDQHRNDAVTLGRDAGSPTWLRHASRRANSVPVGVPRASPLVGADRALALLPVHGGSVADLAGTAIGDAGDLAAILAMGLVPSLDGSATPVPGIAGAGGRLTPAQRVFQRWNLDERAQDEWRQLFGPGPGAPEAIDMGWVPLVRAWTELAGNRELDAMGVGTPPSRTPTRVGRGTVRPSGNRALSEAMRTLLDLPALPPL